MEFEKYKFRKYDKNYPKLFGKEKMKLKRIFPNAEIEHIGSTAVEGLGGKGVIDILVCVSKKDLQKGKKKLEKERYNLSLTGGDKDRIFFDRCYGFLRKRKIHLQLTFSGSKTEKQTIKFRDKLRRTKRLRKKYNKIKQEAVKLGKKRKDYRDHKNNFIKEVINKK